MVFWLSNCFFSAADVSMETTGSPRRLTEIATPKF
jgi:hypothetical protein